MTTAVRHHYTIGVVGNPNCGKTTLFNALTGSRQRVGNWPGVTVERKVGRYRFEGTAFNLVDLPGTYSLGRDRPGGVSSTSASPGTSCTPARRTWS